MHNIRLKMDLLDNIPMYFMIMWCKLNFFKILKLFTRVKHLSVLVIDYRNAFSFLSRMENLSIEIVMKDGKQNTCQKEVWKYAIMK